MTEQLTQEDVDSKARAFWKGALEEAGGDVRNIKPESFMNRFDDMMEKLGSKEELDENGEVWAIQMAMGLVVTVSLGSLDWLHRDCKRVLVSILEDAEPQPNVFVCGEAVLAAMPFSKAYKKWREQKLRTAVANVAGKVKIPELRANWKGMNDNARSGALEAISAAWLEAYGIKETPRILRFTEEGEGGRITEGYFQPGSFSIAMNTAEDSGWDDFDSTLGSFMHENHHAAQFMLTLGNPPKLPKSIEGDMQMLRADYLFAQGGCGVQVSHQQYMARPIERDAYATMDIAMSILFTKEWEAEILAPVPEVPREPMPLMGFEQAWPPAPEPHP